MQSLDFVHLPVVKWVLLLLSACLIVSAVWQVAVHRRRWYWYYLLVFTQSFLVFAVLAIAALYEVNWNPTLPRPKVNPVADWSIDSCFFLSLALGSFWVYWMKGIRWLAFFLVISQELFLLSAMFIAGMAITGDWL